MMKTSSALEWSGCGASFALTVIQTQEVFQVISLILTIIATLATLAFTIWKWYKAAKQDGKIDEEELKQGIDILIKGAEELKKETKECLNTETEKSETYKNK